MQTLKRQSGTNWSPMVFGVVLLLLLWVEAPMALEPQARQRRSAGDNTFNTAPPELPSEAFGLALVISGQLAPPETLVDSVARDLLAIRAYDTVFETIQDTPPWVPGQVIINVSEAAGASLEAGTYTGFDDLYAQLGVPEIEFISRRHYILLLTFSKPYHAERLTELFRSQPDVKSGQANWYLCCLEDDIVVESDNYTGHYTLYKAWECNLRGCRYRHEWVIELDDGIVIQVRESGTPLETEAASWSRVKVLFR